MDKTSNEIKKLSVTISYDVHERDVEMPEDVLRDLKELKKRGVDVLSINDKSAEVKNVLRWMAKSLSAEKAFDYGCYLNEVEFNEEEEGK